MVDLRMPPSSNDSRPFVAPTMFPVSYMAQFTGVSDDIVNGVVAAGDPITVSSTTVEVALIEVQFISKYRLAGGEAVWKGATIGDWVSFSLAAPGTTGTSNSGAGVYDKYALGAGMNMYIPNATQTGDWDIDLDEKFNSNVDFTKAVPVPALSLDGFFDWDMDTGVLTLNASKEGRYNLFDFELPLRTFVQKVPLIGESSQMFTVPAIKPYMCLPHWHVHLTVNNSSEKTLDFGAFLYRGLG